ncbi:hypothetical protein DY218_27425 [Streptomyces triticagri]|uniref:Uncharacterized protein n=1 Tax=Streptomyces triticagri TaxID=2293568 RepID=A0A372LYD3_9ACTN|nr:hypothetical protein [Streptomyces triticagri]RFU83641.1 hypothetical protein DY218_27425 [Streptomyces triticagri]
MLLITRATNDIELTECSGDCEYVCISDEREALGWGLNFGDEWLCEECYLAWADEWGIPVAPVRTAA